MCLFVFSKGWQTFLHLKYPWVCEVYAAMQGCQMQMVKLAHTVQQVQCKSLTQGLSQEGSPNQPSLFFYFQVFHDVAYKAKDRNDLIAGIDEFLDQVTVLPPGEWDPSIRIEPPKNVPSQVSSNLLGWWFFISSFASMTIM